MAKVTRAAGKKVPVERKWSHSATVRKLHETRVQREGVRGQFSFQLTSCWSHTQTFQTQTACWPVYPTTGCWLALLQTQRAGGSLWPYSYCSTITTFSLLTVWPWGKRSDQDEIWASLCVLMSSHTHCTSVLDIAVRGNVAVRLYFLAYICLNHFNVECVWAV